LEAEAEKRLDELESRLGFRFKQRELLREAMTHTSWINERGVAGRDNERLEYLGDAVLELVAGEYLFKRFPGYDEGQLTQIRSSLVSTVALARLGEELRLGDTLRLGKGAAKSGARRLTSLHANAFEALVGATFLDQGYRRAGRIFLSRIGDLSAWTDPNFKGRLQAVAQEKLGGPPQYRTGPVGQDARSRQYLSQVSVEGHGTLGEGRGGTKQAAEQAAARLALEKLMAPAPKRRRGRLAASPVEAKKSPPAEPAVSPSTLPVAPSAGEEASAPRRKRRRSRSRPAEDLLTPEAALPEPSGSEPAALQTSGGTDPFASSPAAPAAGDEASSPRRKRRRSRSRPAAEQQAPEADVLPAALLEAAGGPLPETSVEEAAAGRRRRRRSRSKSPVAPVNPPDAATERVTVRPPIAGTPVAAAVGAPSRRGTRPEPAVGGSGQAPREVADFAREPGRAGPRPGSEASIQEFAAAPEGTGAPRRTRRGHRGGRRRTKVVVAGPE
jgi:ribonuclease-3